MDFPCILLLVTFIILFDYSLEIAVGIQTTGRTSHKNPDNQKPRAGPQFIVQRIPHDRTKESRNNQLSPQPEGDTHTFAKTIARVHYIFSGELIDLRGEKLSIIHKFIQLVQIVLKKLSANPNRSIQDMSIK
ncbi:MAG: hypothetical protein A3K09_03425 [Nitrospinae bacterium RIFCSPLOWO2_12_FULL_47_7]|nr:MAG: hypothetical protein A3K09_03425 [Nitrospinae bacterium RIFCSPLOWO2_12_FULL_47_7]